MKLTKKAINKGLSFNIKDRFSIFKNYKHKFIKMGFDNSSYIAYVMCYGDLLEY